MQLPGVSKHSIQPACGPLDSEGAAGARQAARLGHGSSGTVTAAGWVRAQNRGYVRAGCTGSQATIIRLTGVCRLRGTPSWNYV